MFDGLTAELAGPAAAVLTACELEELLDERGREVLRQLLQWDKQLRFPLEPPRVEIYVNHVRVMLPQFGHDRVHQGRLAGSPAAENPYGEVRVAVGDDPGESLGDIRKLQCGFG
jgi:hypothetical protein